MSATTGIIIRKIDLQRDEASLRAFDAGYVSDRIYRSVPDDGTLQLIENRLETPFRKHYPFDDIADDAGDADFTRIAIDADGQAAGFVLAKRMDWNASVELSALFVAPACQRRGIGARLLQLALDYAASTGLPRMRLETQNSNFGAISFYRRHGFRLCGIDLSLYDPARYPQEFALHFDRAISGQGEAPVL